MDATFENVLSRRRVPEMPDYLCANIIAAAQRQGVQYRGVQSKAVDLKAWAVDQLSRAIASFQAGFTMPVQAMAVAATLVFGVTVGLTGEATDLLFLPDMTTNDLSSILEIEDRFVASEFLSEDWTL